MKYIFLLILIPFVMNAQDLEKHQWENRVIVIASPTFGNSQAAIQLASLKVEAQALKERKVIVYHVTNSGFTVNFDKEVLVSEKSESAITSFNVSLIGLDGTEKFHATEMQKAVKFFSLIDAMPMRQREIKGNNKE
tara:strand:- start:324 stop:731 length:408 start_codon:yes stop_codon:yes gene_type:complete